MRTTNRKLVVRQNQQQNWFLGCSWYRHQRLSQLDRKRDLGNGQIAFNLSVSISLKNRCVPYHLLLLFLFQAVAGMGGILEPRQTNFRTDSLKNLLVHASPQEQVTIYNELCMSLIYEQPDSALFYAEKALVIAREIEDERGISLSLNRIGSANIVKGDYGTGLSHLLNALRLAEKVGDKMLIVRSLNSLGAIYLMQKDYPKAIRSFENLLTITKELKNVQGEAIAYNNLAEIYLYTGDYKLSHDHSVKALEVANRIGFASLKGSIWVNLGKVMANDKKYEQAEAYFRKAKVLNDSLRQFTQLVDAKVGLANVYRFQKKLLPAETEAQEAYKLAVSLKVKEQEMDAADELKKIYLAKGDYKQAYIYLERFNEVKEEISNAYTQQRIQNLQSEYLLEKQDAEIKLLNKRRELQQVVTIILLAGTLLVSVVAFLVYRSSRIKHKANLMLTERNQEINEQKEELRVQKESLQKANNMISAKNEAIQTAYNNIELLSTIGLKITSSLSVETIIETVYSYVNELMDASGFGIGVYNERNRGIDFIGFIEKGEKIPFHTDFLHEKEKISVWCFCNQRELFMNNLEEDFVRLFPYKMVKVVAGDIPKSVIYLPLVVPKNKETVGVITVQSFSTDAYSDYHVSVLRNLGIYASIAIQNARNFEQLDHQRKEISSQNEQITNSITYAQRIQEAILPSAESYKRVFADHFVLYKPRDIVSGDFHWMHEVETAGGHSKAILALVDCTGHGIPGAFMSFIGNALLNQIVIDRAIYQPDEILKAMHQGIRKALKQDNNDNRDGMDMAVCTIDRTSGELSYAGARIPLVYFQQGKLRLVKPDRNGIGGEHFKQKCMFTLHTLTLQPDTTLYLYSDGFQDQFGGHQKRKFMAARFRETLAEIHSLPMKFQKEKLEGILENWMEIAKEGQVDDVMVLGGKLS